MFKLMVTRRPLNQTTSNVFRCFASQSSTSSEGAKTAWEPKNESELRSALIKAAFIHAKDVGFNDQAIVEACKDFGYPSVSQSIVKRGPIDVVDYAMEFWFT